MSFIESDYAKLVRTRELHAQFLRRRMLVAEERGDVPMMRELQGRYHVATGKFFETTLNWEKRA